MSLRSPWHPVGLAQALKAKGKQEMSPSQQPLNNLTMVQLNICTLNFRRNSVYLYFRCSWHTHQFLIDGTNQQPILFTSNQYLPHITAQPAQASHCYATVEDVDDEDAGPVTPLHYHVTSNTTPDPL